MRIRASGFDWNNELSFARYKPKPEAGFTEARFV
jgi:hypothetical protein